MIIHRLYNHGAMVIWELDPQLRGVPALVHRCESLGEMWHFSLTEIQDLPIERQFGMQIQNPWLFSGGPPKKTGGFQHVPTPAPHTEPLSAGAKVKPSSSRAAGSAMARNG